MAEKDASKDEEKATAPVPVPPAKPTLPDDQNPMQWNSWKRARLVSSVCVPVLALTYTSSSYVASLRLLEVKYDASREAIVSGVSLFVLGFGLGPLIFGPTSDIIGRRKVYIYSYGLFTAFSWGTAYANNLAALLIFRLLAGISGASSLNNAPASIGDITTPVQRMKWTVPYAMCAFGGPSLGPLLGGLIDVKAGGNWNLVVNAIFVTVCWLWLILDSPETHGPTLLKHYEEKVDPEKAKSMKLSKSAVIQRYKTAMYKPFYLLFTEPVLAAISIYLSFLYALIYGLFNVFPIIYREVRGYSAETFAYTYFSLAGGFLIGAVILAGPMNTAYFRAVRASAPKRPTPDKRFGGLYWTCWMIPLAFLLTATTSYKHVSAAGNLVAEILFACGTLLVFTTFIPFIIEMYTVDAGSALAAATSARAISAAAFPLFTTQMYHKLGIPGASGIFLGISLLLAPMPWVFKWQGKRLWPNYL